jgi:hypothetical protein
MLPAYSYGLPKTQRPTVTDGRLTETDGKTQRGQRDWRKPYGDWRKPDGYAWEQGTMEPVCMCAGVPVLAVVYQYTGVQHFRWFRYNFPSIVLCVCWNYPMISFSSPNVCLRPPLGFPNGFVMISYAFLTASCCLSMVPYVFLSVRMFVWFSCEFPSEFLWFPVVFL